MIFAKQLWNITLIQKDAKITPLITSKVVTRIIKPT